VKVKSESEKLRKSDGEQRRAGGQRQGVGDGLGGDGLVLVLLVLVLLVLVLLVLLLLVLLLVLLLPCLYATFAMESKRISLTICPALEWSSLKTDRIRNWIDVPSLKSVGSHANMENEEKCFTQ